VVHNREAAVKVCKYVAVVACIVAGGEESEVEDKGLEEAGKDVENYGAEEFEEMEEVDEVVEEIEEEVEEEEGAEGTKHRKQE
jgi:4-hydroxy-3-methylbut-2-en-1-yl diphosphate synthase IspG/GcpE